MDLIKAAIAATTGKDAARTTFKEESVMASFSVVNNIASANAQANLINTSNGLHAR